MSFSLISNLGSLESQSKLSVTGAKLNQAIQRLSSGLRINTSGDDAAGLAIANKYRSDISVISQGVRNANDGLSTLQTIDGGLGNISNLLDRASVLSAQGASDTFTGNRDVLQQEFSKVLAEITRQAQSIGLVSGGVNNKALTTVIGGGSDTFSATNSNNGVQLDLSGTANRVDATGLGLSSVNIGALTGSANAPGGAGTFLNFGTAGATLTAAETLTFQYVGSTGTLTSSTVAFTAGQTANSALAQAQNDATLKTAGITASVNSTGELEFSSANFFSVVSSVAASAVQTGIGIGSIVSSAANSTTVTGLAATAGAAQNLDFTIGASGTIVQQAFTTGTSAALSAAAIATAVNGNATLRDAGIFAIYDAAATTTKIVSTRNTFALNAENTVVAANMGVAAGASTITAGTGAGGAAGAKSALDLLKTAITTLGSVQGTIGAGQNRLQQAIDLASSQITNFQAAESRVRDADVAAEASSMSRLSVLQQAGVAALAQANQSSQAVLSLLR
jgi:flagellin